MSHRKRTAWNGSCRGFLPLPRRIWLRLLLVLPVLYIMVEEYMKKVVCQYELLYIKALLSLQQNQKPPQTNKQTIPQKNRHWLYIHWGVFFSTQTAKGCIYRFSYYPECLNVRDSSPRWIIIVVLNPQRIYYMLHVFWLWIFQCNHKDKVNPKPNNKCEMLHEPQQALREVANQINSTRSLVYIVNIIHHSIPNILVRVDEAPTPPS